MHQEKSHQQEISTENFFSLHEKSNMCFTSLCPEVWFTKLVAFRTKKKGLSDGGWWPARVANGLHNYQNSPAFCSWLLLIFHFYYTSQKRLFCSRIILTSYYLFKLLKHALFSLTAPAMLIDPYINIIPIVEFKVKASHFSTEMLVK